MSNIIKFSDEARQALMKGADILANTVKLTLGPNGRNVIINTNGNPRITKDGVSVAKEISLKDSFEDAGAQIIKEVASKMGDEVGDGTTTATILAQAILHAGISEINNGANLLDLKKGIDIAVKEVKNSILEHALPVNDDLINNVATISTNNDLECGKLISDAIKEVGYKGLVSMEYSNSKESFIKVNQGIKLNKGYASPYFVTNAETMDCEFENPYVLFINNKLEKVKDILWVLDTCAKNDQPLLLFVKDIDAVALETLIMNRVKRQLKICVVKANFLDKTNEIFSDMALISGGKEIYDLSNFDRFYIGKFAKITVSNNSILFINGGCKKEDLDSYVKSLTDEERINRLTQGVCVIHIGGLSESEKKEKWDRIEDGLYATKAAIESGIVPGGGTTYLRTEIKSISDNKSIQAGINIIKNVLSVPFKQLCENNKIDYKVTLDEINSYSDYFYGYDGKQEKVCNLLENGIIDPAKVAIEALENAASVVGIFLTTECIICNEI